MIPEAGKYAWVTLSTEPQYLPGAVALARSLRQCHSEHRLIVMVTPASDASMIDVLESEGCEIRTVEPIVIQNSPYAAARYANVWTKLRVWGLEDLTRAIFLDTNMLVLRNMDELFQIELPPGGIAASPACVCNPHHKSTYPKTWVPENCYYTYARADSGRPTGFRIATDRDYFNTGLLVFEPNRATLAAFLGRLASPDAPDYPFADQDFLNEYFRARWRILPSFFNALKTLRLCHPSLWNIAAVRNIHYILEKPWQAGDARDNPYQHLDLLWRDIYEGQRLPCLTKRKPLFFLRIVRPDRGRPRRTAQCCCGSMRRRRQLALPGPIPRHPTRLRNSVYWETDFALPVFL